MSQRRALRSAQCTGIVVAISAMISVVPLVVARAQSPAPTPQASTTPASAAPAAPTAANEPYNPTLNYGVGLIDDPVAWISPNNSEFWLTYGVRRIPSGPVETGGLFSYWNGNLSLDTHWLQRFDVGFSLYSNNPEWGFYGSVLAIKENQFASFMPAIAFGFRNLGPYPHEERFLIGTDVTVDSSGHSHEITPFYFKKFNTAPTLYVVATKNFLIHTSWLSNVRRDAGRREWDLRSGWRAGRQLQQLRHGRAGNVFWRAHGFAPEREHVHLCGRREQRIRLECRCHRRLAWTVARTVRDRTRQGRHTFGVELLHLQLRQIRPDAQLQRQLHQCRTRAVAASAYH